MKNNPKQIVKSILKQGLNVLAFTVLCTALCFFFTPTHFIIPMLMIGEFKLAITKFIVTWLYLYGFMVTINCLEAFITGKYPVEEEV